MGSKCYVVLVVECCVRIGKGKGKERLAGLYSVVFGTPPPEGET